MKYRIVRVVDTETEGSDEVEAIIVENLVESEETETVEAIEEIEATDESDKGSDKGSGSFVAFTAFVINILSKIVIRFLIFFISIYCNSFKKMLIYLQF